MTRHPRRDDLRPHRAARSARGAGARPDGGAASPGSGEVLIKVAAAGINRPDVLQREGGYPTAAGATDVPGLEVAGEVVAVGEGVRAVAPRRPGHGAGQLRGYAEYCLAPAPQGAAGPAGAADGRGRRHPRDLLHRLDQRVRPRPPARGESLLVHGGSSGIGTTAIQLAHAFGATVFATVGGEDKRRACEELGAKRAINYREEDFVAVVKEATGGKGSTSSSTWSEGLRRAQPPGARCRRPAGPDRLAARAEVEANFMPLMLKRLTWTGSTLRPRSVEQKARSPERWRPRSAAARRRPGQAPGPRHLPARRGRRRHRLMESSQHIGKIVLVP